MKKLVLTSCGIRSNALIEEVKVLIDKPIKEVKVLFIPVAADGEKGDKTWIQEECNSILELGIHPQNIITYRMDNEIDIKLFDIIYVLGGNTFYLLNKIRQTKFDKKIKEAIDNGIVYVGSSAGSIIMGHTIETALPFDEYDGYLDSFEGLKLFNGIIIPHYGELRKQYVKEQTQKYEEKIYAISDNHGLIVIDNVIKEI